MSIMENIKKIFDKIKIEKHNSINGKSFLDPIRNIFIQITPEEIVAYVKIFNEKFVCAE